MTDEPILSVLIPAYAYKQGVLRILDALPLGSPEIEVIVHDDSPNVEIEAAMSEERFRQVTYRHNVPPLGAVANWNGLIEAARGRYFALMHHDEYPADSDFAERVLRALKDEPAPDIFLFGLRLRRKGVPYSFRLVPEALRRWLIADAPGYLLKRNFIGPSACLLIRRSIAPRFDPNLVWLVDVDFYLKALERSWIVKQSKTIDIVSETGRAESITRSLSPDLGEIALRERRELVDKHLSTTGLKRLDRLGLFEPLFWCFFRLIGLFPSLRNRTTG